MQQDNIKIDADILFPWSQLPEMPKLPKVMIEKLLSPTDLAISNFGKQQFWVNTGNFGNFLPIVHAMDPGRLR